ncbi:MAG: DUF4097 family beta strand repeat-containing protein [Mycobacteriales bacterium]
MNTPLRSSRRVWLGIGGLLLIGIIGQTGLAVIAFYGRTTYVTTVAIEPVGGQLQVRSGNSDVSVHPSADGRVHIQTRARYGLRRPKLEQRSGARGIELAADCSWFDSRCGVDYDIAVPQGQALVVSSGSGDIAVTDLGTSAEIFTGSGDVTVDRLTGPALDLRTGSGDIRVRGSRVGNVTARTGSGDISAEFAEAPTAVEARAGSGDVTIVLPEGAYAVDADTGSGDRTVDVATDPKAEHTILVRTGSGDARVRPPR